MLFLIAEIALCLVLAGVIGLLTGVLLNRQLSWHGMQETIETWRDRLSVAESDKRALRTKGRELATQINVQEAEVKSLHSQLRGAMGETEVYRKRLETARAEVASHRTRIAELEKKSDEQDERWQETLQEKEQEAAMLAAALRSGDTLPGGSADPSEEASNLRQMLSERDDLIASLQRRLQHLESFARSRPTGAPLDDIEIDDDRSLFLSDPVDEAPPKARWVGDDLTRIRGIGSSTRFLLGQYGVSSFRQLAGWTGEEIELWAERLQIPAERIREMRWVEQAKGLDESMLEG